MNTPPPQNLRELVMVPGFIPSSQSNDLTPPGRSGGDGGGGLYQGVLGEDLTPADGLGGYSEGGKVLP